MTVCMCGKEMVFMQEVKIGACTTCQVIHHQIREDMEQSQKEFSQTWADKQLAWNKNVERGDAFDTLAQELKVMKDDLPW